MTAARNAGVHAMSRARSSAIFSASAPMVEPGLTAPTVGNRLPSATRRFGTAWQRPLRVGDRGRGIAAHARRAEQMPAGERRQREAHDAMGAGGAQHLLGAVEAEIEAAAGVLRQRVLDLHAGQAVGSPSRSVSADAVVRLRQVLGQHEDRRSNGGTPRATAAGRRGPRPARGAPPAAAGMFSRVTCRCTPRLKPRRSSVS